MKTVKQRLLDSLEQSTASGRAIANYMLANLNELPFETAASIATKVGVGEMSVGRFCRSIGYIHFKELKADLKGNIGDSPWLVGDRLREFAARAQSGNDQLASSLEFEISTMVRVYEIAQSPEFERFVQLLREHNLVMNVETLQVLLLNTRRRLIRVEPVTNGTIDTLLVHPREVFKAAIAANAAAVVLAHNHPSGDPTPSEADIKVTRDLIRAGQLLKIEVLDHVIIGRATPERPKDYASLRELGYFYS